MEGGRRKGSKEDDNMNKAKEEEGNGMQRGEEKDSIMATSEEKTRGLQGNERVRRTVEEGKEGGGRQRKED